MRRFFLIVSAALLSLGVLSCSDESGPLHPGPRPATGYQGSIEFLTTPTRTVWGRSADEEYVGGDVLLRFDGASWTPMALPERMQVARHLSGTTAGVLNIGDYDYVYQFDGVEWSSFRLPDNVSDAWVSLDGDAFACGWDGRLHRFDGAAWHSDSLAVSPYWRRITGSSAADVYATSYRTIAHFDGTSWSVSRLAGQFYFEVVWKPASGPLFVAEHDSLFTYDGTSLQPFPGISADFRAHSLWGNSTSDIYALGFDYASPYKGAFRFDGSSWARVMGTNDDLDSGWTAPTGEVFLCGEAVWRASGGVAERMLGPEGRYPWESEFFDSWGSPDDGLFIVGYSAYRFDGRQWNDLDKESITNLPARAVWGTSGQNLYAVGEGMILHYDGETWTWESGAFQSELTDVWASEKEAIAVGRRGVILHSKGTGWERMESGTSYDLYAVWGWGNGALAAGEGGAVMRYDGRTWQPEPAPISWSVYGLFGFGANRIYAVGSSSSEICFFDGRRWTALDSDLTGYGSSAIWGTDQNNLFLAKSNGGVSHFDGTEWTSLPRFMIRSPGSIWGLPGGDLFLVSRTGVVRYRR